MLIEMTKIDITTKGKDRGCRRGIDASLGHVNVWGIRRTSASVSRKHNKGLRGCQDLARGFAVRSRRTEEAGRGDR